MSRTTLFGIFRGMWLMSQLLRQIGVVIGLTVILTFPVTVVSGAGSQNQPDHNPNIWIWPVGGSDW